MDWATLVTSIVASVLGSSLIVGLLTWWLDRHRFGHQQAMDVSHLELDRWQQVQQSFEKEIDTWEKAGDTTNANEARREYALQQVAWRAQQRVTGLAPREARLEGGTSLAAEEVAELRRLLAASAGLNPGALSAEDYFLRGNSYYETGQYQEALADHNRALELQADDPHILNHRGMALGNLGRYNEALLDFSRALELRPDYPDALYNRAITLRNLGHHDESLADINGALKLRPNHPDTLNNRGNTLVHLGRYQEALVDFNRALELQPDDRHTLCHRGIALRNLGRYQEALADYNRALELQPDDTDTLGNRGNALANLRRYDEALADYNRAMELEPDRPITLYNVACLFSLAERYPEALDWLARAISGDAKYRSMAIEDADFAPLRDHPQYGPQFRQLVGGGVSPPS